MCGRKCLEQRFTAACVPLEIDRKHPACSEDERSNHVHVADRTLTELLDREQQYLLHQIACGIVVTKVAQALPSARRLIRCEGFYTLPAA